MLSRATKIALVIIPINTLIWFIGIGTRDIIGPVLVVFSVAALAQLVFGVRAITAGVRRRRAKEGGLLDIILGIVTSLGALVGWFLGTAGLALSGGGGMPGRPLRVRGKALRPDLTDGEDWTSGPRPDPEGLDLPTRRALEALWLHDARQEHASVPAFARVSWLLAAAGGPAALMIDCHRAATEEIEHTLACFALAAGYGARSFTVEPMPELSLAGAIDPKVDARVTLAAENLADGCQLEGFNADIAAASAEVCEEPVTRALLQRIAFEERGHAELSWAILGWLVERHRAVVEAPLRAALIALDHHPRPTAFSDEDRVMVGLADRAALRRHGRLDDAEWAAAWAARLQDTRARFTALLAAPLRNAA